MAKFLIFNPNLIDEEPTELSSSYSSGTALTVDNNSNFTANRFVVVGEPGQEKAESKQITGITDEDQVDLVSALNHSHALGSPVYESRWSQWSVERDNAGNGSYSEISISPINIDWANPQHATLVEDDDGGSTDNYRWRPYNPVTGTYGSYSDAMPATGFGENTIGSVLVEIRKNPILAQISFETLIGYANDYELMVLDEVPNAKFIYKEGTEVSTVANTYKYSISSNWSDYSTMKYLLYKYVSGDIEDTYPLEPISYREMLLLKTDANQPSDDNALYWTEYPRDGSSEKGYIAIHPTPETTSCSLIPVYNTEFGDLDSFGDVLKIPIRKGYLDYIKYRCFDDLLNDEGNANRYNARVMGVLKRLKQRARMQTGSSQLRVFRGQKGHRNSFGRGINTGQDRVEAYY